MSYTVQSPNFKSGKADVKNQYVLLANTTESKFFSPRTEYIDSLNSTPEGAAKWSEMARNAYLGGKFDQLPRRDGKYYLVKSLANNKLTYYDSAGLDKFVYEETPDEWQWNIGENTKEILGYECIEATTDFHGRKWTVWFSPEIPVQNGPWKFDGLPGLILEVVCEGDLYSFTATGIQQSSKEITPVYLAKEYESTTRKELLKEQRAFLDNTLNRLNNQLGGVKVIKVTDENGNDISNALHATRETVDFIETDY